MSDIGWFERDKTVNSNFRRYRYEFNGSNTETVHRVGMSEMRRKNRNDRESVPVERHIVPAVRVRWEAPGLPEMRNPDEGKSFMEVLICVFFRIIPENNGVMVL